jgi:chromate transporter
MRPLAEIVAVFLKLGLVAVGGPAVHVALMRREAVTRRRWLDEREFFQAFAACQLIPGPSSTELAIMLGYRRAGMAGLLLAGTLFILPAMLIMLALAWAYQNFASSPVFAHALTGVRAAVVGVMTWALLDLGRRIVTGPLALLLSLLLMVGGLSGINPALLLLLGGLAATAGKSFSGKSLPAGAGGSGWGVALLAATSPSLLGIFLTFLKYGAISFGSGYVLFAFLQGEIVGSNHWLTTHQLLDAIAISQATPGPVFTVATFIGFLVGGLPAALLATLGMFLPGFILVPFLDRIVGLVRRRPWVKAFLDGVNLAALGLIAEVVLLLGRTALVDVTSVAIAALVFLVLLRAPLAAPILVLAGAGLGLVGLR